MGITMIVMSSHWEVVLRCFEFIEPHFFEFPVVFDRIRGCFLARINTWHDRFGDLFDPTALCRRGMSEGLSFTKRFPCGTHSVHDRKIVADFWIRVSTQGMYQFSRILSGLKARIHVGIVLLSTHPAGNDFQSWNP